MHLLLSSCLSPGKSPRVCAQLVKQVIITVCVENGLFLKSIKDSTISCFNWAKKNRQKIKYLSDFIPAQSYI